MNDSRGWRLLPDRFGSLRARPARRLALAACRRLLAAWLLLLCRHAPPAMAQAPYELARPISFSGVVVDAQGKPAPEAVVRLSADLISVRLDEAAVANANGEFRLQAAWNPEALHSLRLEAWNHDQSQSVLYRFAEDRKGTTLDDLRLQLQPLKEGKVRVVDAQDRPIAAAHVALQLEYPYALSGAVTDAEGWASYRLPQGERIEAAIAWKDQHGLDYRIYRLPRAQRADLKSQPAVFPAEEGEKLTLEGAAPLTVRVRDDAGRPVRGVRVSPWLLSKGTQDDHTLNLSYLGEAIAQATDADGAATLAWIPAWQKTPVTIWPWAEGYVRVRGQYDPATQSGPLELQLDRLQPIRGRVVHADGTPAAGVVVDASGAGYSIDRGRATVRTDETGSYELLVPPDQMYLVIVRDEKWAAAPRDGFVVRKNQPVEGVDFELRPVTRVFGALVNEETREPLPNQRVHVYQYGRDLQSLPDVELPNPENSNLWVRPIHTFAALTDQQGRFEFALGDGSFDIRPPDQRQADPFTIDGQEELELGVEAKVLSDVLFTGLVVDKGTKRPLAGVKVRGVPSVHLRSSWLAVTGEDGKFQVLRKREPTVLHAANAEQTLACIANVAGEQNVFVLQLQPTGAAAGRLLADDGKTPVAGATIEYGVQVSLGDGTVSYRFGGQVLTGPRGEFRLEGLVADAEYLVFCQPDQDGRAHTLARPQVEPGEELDLGEVKLPAPPQAKRNR